MNFRIFYLHSALSEVIKSLVLYMILFGLFWKFLSKSFDLLVVRIALFKSLGYLRAYRSINDTESELKISNVKVVSFDEFYKCMMEHNDEAFGEALKKLEARL